MAFCLISDFNKSKITPGYKPCVQRIISLDDAATMNVKQFIELCCWLQKRCLLLNETITQPTSTTLVFYFQITVSCSHRRHEPRRRLIIRSIDICIRTVAKPLLYLKQSHVYKTNGHASLMQNSIHGTKRAFGMEILIRFISEIEVTQRLQMVCANDPV